MAITKDQKKQSFVVGNAVADFFWQRDAFLEKMKNFPKVYVYMTERVSETHGFALVEQGELKRFFCTSDDGVENIGEPLPEETELGLDLADVKDRLNDGGVTEDTILTLAIRQAGIDPEKYKYENVIVGELYLEVDPLNDQ